MQNELQNRKREQALLQSEHEAQRPRLTSTISGILAIEVVHDAFLSRSFDQVEGLYVRPKRAA